MRLATFPRTSVLAVLSDPSHLAVTALLVRCPFTFVQVSGVVLHAALAVPFAVDPLALVV